MHWLIILMSIAPFLTPPANTIDTTCFYPSLHGDNWNAVGGELQLPSGRDATLMPPYSVGSGFDVATIRFSKWVVDTDVTGTDPTNAGKWAIETDAAVSNSRVQFPWSFAGNGTDYFGACWIKPLNTGTGNQVIIQDRVVGAGAETPLYLFTSNGNLAFASLDTASNLLIEVSTAALTNGQWHHAAFVRSGTTVTIYLDGVAVGSDTNAAVLPVQTHVDVSLGRRDGGDFEQLSARYDDFCVMGFTELPDILAMYEAGRTTVA